jgi:hypothetical protein
MKQLIFNTRTTRIGGLTAMLAVFLVASPGCKKQEAHAKERGATGSSTADPTAAASAKASELLAPALAMLDEKRLANVCNGMPEKGAKAYAKEPGKIHPLILFSRTSESDEWTKPYSDKFDGWKADAPADYQLVGCVTATKVTKVKECKFDAKKPVRFLDLADVSYELRVMEAGTGKELSKKTVEVKAPTRCPMFHMFHEQRETQHPDFAPSFIEFAKPIVAPKS